jgi:hypothetical protein
MDPGASYPDCVDGPVAETRRGEAAFAVRRPGLTAMLRGR